MDLLLAGISALDLKHAYHLVAKEVQGNLPIEQRLCRAYEILTQSTVYEIIADASQRYTVRTLGRTYTVDETIKHCNCPDGMALCKHRLAVRILLTAYSLGESHGSSVQNGRSVPEVAKSKSANTSYPTNTR